jgi:hypothetical protein
MNTFVSRSTDLDPFRYHRLIKYCPWRDCTHFSFIRSSVIPYSRVSHSYRRLYSQEKCPYLMASHEMSNCFTPTTLIEEVFWRYSGWVICSFEEDQYLITQVMTTSMAANIYVLLPCHRQSICWRLALYYMYYPILTLYSSFFRARAARVVRRVCVLRKIRQQVTKMVRRVEILYFNRFQAIRNFGPCAPLF